MKGLNLLFVFVSFQRGWKSLTAVFMLPRRMSSMWEGLFFLCRQTMGGKIGYGTLEGEGDEEKEGKEFEVLLNYGSSIMRRWRSNLGTMSDVRIH